MSTTKLRDHTGQETKVEEVEKIILCAKWLVREFEELDCQSLAALFQRAVNDAEAWVENIVKDGKISREYAIQPLAKEAEMLRKFLIKYTSIPDPSMRQDLLKDMTVLTKKKAH